MFITFEGGEGAGKTTQIKLLADRLKASGKGVITTREPGGTADAEEVRSLLVSGSPDRWSPIAEALLNYAARDNHLRVVIRPHLNSGTMVLCDRFMDSTRAYQADAAISANCPSSLLDELERVVVGQTRPDLTFVFDLDPELGLLRARLQGKGDEDRFERKGLAFHQRLREAFLQIAKREPKRCKVIDASASIEIVATQIWGHVGG